MDSTTGESTNDVRRPLLASAIVFASIAVPLIVAGWSLHSSLAGKPLGRPSAESKIYQGSLRKGELWFTVFRIHRDGVKFDCQVRRLNLETGVESETEYSASGVFAYPLWLNDEFFGVSQSSIYRMAEGKSTKICDLPVRISQFHTMPFVLDGQVTTIAELDSGGFRLLHLVDDHWVDGREIRLPGPGTAWQNDTETNQPVLQPGSSNTVPAPVRTCWVMAVQHGSQVHVLQTDASSFAAYRSGFEFVDSPPDGASALSPINAAQEFSGWEPIQGGGHNPRLMWMACDSQGLLFCGHAYNDPLLRRTNSGVWRKLETPAAAQHSTRVLVAEPASSISYLIDEDQRWSSTVIHRIEQDRIQPAHVTLTGVTPEYLSRWRQAAGGLLVAWLLHLLLLLGGALWLQPGKRLSTWHFGIQQATLSSIERRGMACGLDLLFVLLAPLLTIWIQLPAWKAVDDRALGTQLLNLEMTLGSVITRSPSPGGNLYWELKSFLGPLLELDYAVEIAEVLILIGLLLWLESRTGITPGKWLVGIRTVRSTLRPAGFFRIVVRRLLYWVDMPLLLTPLPAAISVMLSTHKQRIGDRVADTIVIRNGSIRDETKSVSL